LIVCNGTMINRSALLIPDFYFFGGALDYKFTDFKPLGNLNIDAIGEAGDHITFADRAGAVLYLDILQGIFGLNQSFRNQNDVLFFIDDNIGVGAVTGPQEFSAGIGISRLQKEWNLPPYGLSVKSLSVFP